MRNYRISVEAVGVGQTTGRGIPVNTKTTVLPKIDLLLCRRLSIIIMLPSGFGICKNGKFSCWREHACNKQIWRIKH